SDAIAIRRHAVMLLECRALDPVALNSQVRDRSHAHQVLGQLYRDQLQFDSAIEHLKIAESYLGRADAESDSELESRLRLGMAFLRAKAYDEADRTFREMIDQAFKLMRRPARPPASTIDEIALRDHLGFALNFRAFGYALRGVNHDTIEKLIRD